jgi:hypothetical protein
VNLAIARAEELGIHKPGVKKNPSELYIPYNNTTSTTSSMDDDNYISTLKTTEKEQEDEIEQVVVQLDLGSSTVASL